MGGGIVQEIEKVSDARGRQRADRTGRNRIDPDVIRAQFHGKISDIGLQRRFGAAHHVVIGSDSDTSDIREGDHRAPIDSE